MNTEGPIIKLPKPEFNFYNLSFKDSTKLLEKTFILNYFERSLKQLRLCIILSIVVYAAFGIVDINAVPKLKNIFWIIRYAVYCPMAIGMFVYTYSMNFKKYFQTAISIFAIFATVWLLIINSLASSNGFYSYRYAIFLSLIFIYNLARLRFIYATLTGWIIFILYNLLTLLIQNTPLNEFIDVNVLLFSINIFGMISCYFLEYYERKNYFLVSLLNEKNKEVENTNQELERKVFERTNQLEEANVELQKANSILKEEITERKKAEKEIINLSYHDKLTGLYNRRFYEEEIKKLDKEDNLPISIIIGDVNGLKLINDAFGHDKGDELLQKAAAAIRSVCRTDDIVARWGGDEFVVLLPGTTSEEAENIVSKITDVYSNEYVNAIRVSISFGWDTKKKADESILKVLKSAEDYMYQHKLIENESIKGNTINTVIKTLHEKNSREEQHSKRVSEICQNIGEALGISEIQVNQLKVAGLLHDIGKIAIDGSILNKPGKLDASEQNEIRRHPEIGSRILSSSFEMMELAGYILAHHERWDGTGYPKRLKGEAIPVAARIIALADSYDAMTSERPYRSALSDDAALDEIRKNVGFQFDPEIARVFIEKVLNKLWY